MRVVVLAGGEGRRLRPFTIVIPKPLAPLGNYSILEIVLRQLKHDNFEHVTLAVGYHSELIQSIIGDGTKYGLRIDYSFETSPLGTIGPLRQISGLTETFMVMNGDILTDMNYRVFLDFHRKHGGVATIAAHRQVEEISLGVLESDENGRLTGFREKPKYDYMVSMGIYAFEPRILEFIAPGEPLGLDQLMFRLLQAELPIYTYPFQGSWIDIGRHEDFGEAMELFTKNEDHFLRRT